MFFSYFTTSWNWTGLYIFTPHHHFESAYQHFPKNCHSKVTFFISLLKFASWSIRSPASTVLLEIGCINKWWCIYKWFHCKVPNPNPSQGQIWSMQICWRSQELYFQEPWKIWAQVNRTRSGAWYDLIKNQLVWTVPLRESDGYNKYMGCPLCSSDAQQMYFKSVCWKDRIMLCQWKSRRRMCLMK